MQPHISELVRSLTYPNLRDAASTRHHPSVRGLQHSIVLVNHQHPEDDIQDLPERSFHDSTSKQNAFESRMVLKTGLYLMQQGYDVGHLVVLTPYIGQLKMLRKDIHDFCEIVLSDRDVESLSEYDDSFVQQITGAHGLRLSTIGKHIRNDESLA